MRGAFAVAAAGLLAAAPALAGTEIATGDWAAWPAVKESVNLPSFSGKEMDGRVVLLTILRTWDPDSRAHAPRLEEMHAKYRERGFLVLAVTNEAKPALAKFLADTKSTFPAVVEGGDSAGVYGIGGFPHSFLVDGEGIVAWEGSPGVLQDTEIESLLAGAHPLPKLPKRLSAVQKLLEARDYAGARRALLAMKADPLADNPGGIGVDEALGWIALRGKSLLQGAEVNARAQNFLGAADTLRRVMESFRGCEEADRARASLDGILANAAAKREIEAGDLWVKTKAAGKKMKSAPAALAYRAFAKKWEGTRSAVKADAAATALEAQAGR